MNDERPYRMYITNRTILGLIFVLAAGAFVVLGLTGCTPRHSGGDTIPELNIELDESAEEPAEENAEPVV